MVALQLLDKITANMMLQASIKPLDVANMDCKTKLVLIITDGERLIVDRVFRVQTRFKQMAVLEIFLIWFGPHQLDIMVSDDYRV